MKKLFSDFQRLEFVKEFKVSKLSVFDFATSKGVNPRTFRDWVYAFDNIDGSFVKLNKVIDSDNPSVILSNDDISVKLLDSDTIYKKSHHFSRFDHSIVVIEFEKIKVSTSLSQALSILEKYYDRFK